MVKEINNLFECEACGLKYKIKEQAQKCEDWCGEHNSCNLDIIKEAIQE